MLRDAQTQRSESAVGLAPESTWVLEVAARHARRQGVGVRVVLSRAPGVVAAMREAAEASGVKVSTTISPGSVSARFET